MTLALTTLALPRGAWAQQDNTQGEAARPRLTKTPELLEFVEAKYPEDELSDGRAATVVLQIAISETGAVEEVAVVESAGAAFDAAAIEAVRRFRFSPAEIDGRPAPVKVTYRYEFTQQEEVVSTAIFRGIVSAKDTDEPLAGVTLELEGVGTAVTSDRGEFVFEAVPPGTYRVTLSRDDLVPLATEETLAEGLALDVRYAIELPAEDGDEDEEGGDDLEIVVLAPRLVKQAVSTEVSSEEARRVPGTQGDVLKVVENLPGVARASAGSGEVVVWGAAPQDTRTYVGAVRIPMLYHFGGLRSVIHNDRVQSVELIPGGYGAAFGRGLGGLVRVTSRDPAADEMQGSVQVDLLDASAAITAPVGEKVSFAVSARRSHIADLSGVLSDQSFQEFFTLPNYHDGQGRLRYSLAPGEWLEVGGMLSGDRQSRTQPSNDPSRRASEVRTLHFERYDVAYHKQLADGAEVNVAPWYGRDRAGRLGDFGGVPTSLHTESHLVGLRSEWRGRLADEVTAQAGFDFELVRSYSRRSGSITAPPREGDPYVFGRPPADQVNFDDWSSTIASAAPYAEIEWSLFNDKVKLTPGLRFEPFFIDVERRRPHDPSAPDQGLYHQDISVQPRMAVRYSPASKLALNGATGLYQQPPLPDDLSAVFGNPTLGISRGTHYLGGVAYQVLETLQIEVAAFHTRSEELVARNPSSTPRLGEALVQQGAGRSIGAQVLLRKDKADGPFFGWVAYTILRSERRDFQGGPWRLFDYDQTHVLTALASYEVGADFEVGARARLASGFPRTPVLGTYYDVRTDRYEPALGGYNTDRIPMFVQVDMRGAKRFDLDGTELEIYLDIQNVTHRENPEEIAYSPDFSERRYILGLPLLPVLGARWSF